MQPLLVLLVLTLFPGSSSLERRCPGARLDWHFLCFSTHATSMFDSTWWPWSFIAMSLNGKDSCTKWCYFRLQVRLHILLISHHSSTTDEVCYRLKCVLQFSWTLQNCGMAFANWFICSFSFAALRQCKVNENCSDSWACLYLFHLDVVDWLFRW